MIAILPVPLGTVVMTRGISDLMGSISADVAKALARHAAGDWGDVCAEDKETNDAALSGGGQLLSDYTAMDGTKFWIITEWDRSTTTVLLPDEY